MGELAAFVVATTLCIILANPGLPEVRAIPELVGAMRETALRPPLALADLVELAEFRFLHLRLQSALRIWAAVSPHPSTTTSLTALVAPAASRAPAPGPALRRRQRRRTGRRCAHGHRAAHWHRHPGVIIRRWRWKHPGRWVCWSVRMAIGCRRGTRPRVQRCHDVDSTQSPFRSNRPLLGEAQTQVNSIREEIASAALMASAP
mmetsp:Transcript_115259/g.325714  ORF Transcript_115259/g.325714 Transcript_115259/m.325714 type:complete len:204 (-) Transcript_115259:39-650(-)